MWIDSHCHLDSPEFDVDRDEVVAQSRAAGVEAIVNLPPELKGLAEGSEIVLDGFDLEKWVQIKGVDLMMRGTSNGASSIAIGSSLAFSSRRAMPSFSQC